MRCIHELADVFINDSDERILTQLLDATEIDKHADYESFFSINSDESIMKARPWKSNAKYFKKTYISFLLPKHTQNKSYTCAEIAIY